MRGAAACAIVLGSGLSKLACGLESLARVPYASIPGFGRTSVEGHPGFVSLCRIAGAPVLLFAGRFHAYEGAGADALASPVLAREVRGLLVHHRDAGGGESHPPNPAADMDARDRRHPFSFELALPLRPRAVRRRSSGNRAAPRGAPRLERALGGAPALGARGARIPLAEGVLCWTSGPTYETAAEARAGAFMGADAATMSSYPELLAARKIGIEAACMSWITNYTAALSGGRTVHAEVLDSADEGARSLGALVAAFLRARGAA